MHTEAFTQKKLYTEELSHIEAGTQRDFYTLCAETFTHRRTFTRQELLHVDFIDFYTKNFYSTQRTLHAETFIHRNLYTQRNVYARELLRKDASTHTHRIVFTHRNFYTEKYLHIFYRLSYFRIIHDLLSSYLGAHALLVNSLLLFFRGTPSLSFHVAPCSVHPRCPRSPCGESN